MPDDKRYRPNFRSPRRLALAAIAVSLFALQGCAGDSGYDSGPYGYGPDYGYGYPYNGYSYYARPGWYSDGHPEYRWHAPPRPAHEYEENRHPAIAPQPRYRPPATGGPAVPRGDADRESRSRPYDGTTDAYRQHHGGTSSHREEDSGRRPVSRNNRITPERHDGSHERTPHWKSRHERRPTRDGGEDGSQARDDGNR